MIFPDNLTPAEKAQQASMSQGQSYGPPSYGTAYYPGTYVPVGANLVYVDEQRRRRRRRIRHLAIAFITCIFLIGFVRPFSRLWHRGDDGEWEADPKDYPVPGDLEINDCLTQDVKWSNVHHRASLDPFYSAETQFKVPLNSDTLFFLSRGDLSGGTTTVNTDRHLKDDEVNVKVEVHYNYDWVRNLGKVCAVTRGSNEHGVAIFTPQFRGIRRPHDARLTWVVTISLPTSASKHIIKKFETDYPNTKQRVEPLSNYEFDSISLKGSNGGIDVDALFSTIGSIVTTNGHISGVFNTTHSLTLKTTNAAVVVDVGAKVVDSTTSKVSIASTNGNLQAAFSLTSEDDTGGQFDITTTTTNDGLDVKFPVQPLDSVLRFKGSTTNGRAKLALNSAFEGTFSAHTSNAQLDVLRDRSAEDPSGKGRKRDVFIVQLKNRDAHGSAYWSDKHDIKGDVVLTSTNGHLTLQL